MLLVRFLVSCILWSYVLGQGMVYCDVNSNYTAGRCGVTCGQTADCGCLSIKDALNTIPDDDFEIYTVMVLPGIYSGSDNVNITLSEISVNIQSSNGSDSTIISCGTGDTSFDLSSSYSNITGFTLSDCLLTIHDGSQAIITDMNIVETSNSSYPGYVTIIDNSTVEFYDSIFAELTTLFNSPLFFSNYSNVTLDNCTISDNLAENCIDVSNTRDSSFGASSNVNIFNSRFERNNVMAAIRLEVAIVNITDSYFNDNIASKVINSLNSFISISNSHWNNNEGPVIDISTSNEIHCSLSVYSSSFSNGTASELEATGGISSDRCYISIDSSRFTSNIGTTGSAIMLKSPVNTSFLIPSINNCVFEDNRIGDALFDDSDLVEGSGGALYVSGSHSYELIVSNSNFTGNTAPRATGGAIHTKNLGADNPKLTLIDNRFENNAALSGGAIYSSFPINISNCTFLMNSADKHGGAIILSKGDSIVDNCDFEQNIAINYGGAIYYESSDGNLTNSIFKSNAGLNGGGLYIEENCTISVQNCEFYRNVGTVLGGGITIQNSLEDHPLEPGTTSLGVDKDTIENWLREHLRTTISNSTFSNNRAIKGGGIGISTQSTPGIFSCSFDSNNATFGGGIYLEDESGTFVFNTTVSSNTGTYGGGIIIYGTASALFDFVTVFNNSASLNGGAAAVSGKASPVFSNSTFSENRGSSQTGGVELSGSSTPIFIDCTFFNNSSPRGGAFYTTQTASPTFERCFFLNNTVTSFGAGGMFSDQSKPTMTNCTLRGNYAVGEGGGMIIIGSVIPTITDVIFEYNTGYHGGAMDINTNTSFTILRTTFRYNDAYTRGGAIRLSGSASPKFTDVSFENNIAVNGAGIAIYDDSAPIFTRTIFSDNKARLQGGAVLCGDWSAPQFHDCKFMRNLVLNTGGAFAISDFSTPLVNGSAIFENEAPHGGGVYCISGGVTPTFNNCTFTHNTASIDGAALSIHGTSTITLKACIIGNNIAGNYGGGINSEDQSKPNIVDTIFDENRGIRSGGGYAIQGTSSPNITNSIFRKNFAGRGGAIFVSPQARGRIETSDISENLAFFGAGVYIGGFSSFNVLTSVIDNNLSIYGGGVAIESTTASYLNESIVIENKALSGGGIYIFPVYNILASPAATYSTLFSELIYSPFYYEYYDLITDAYLTTKNFTTSMEAPLTNIKDNFYFEWPFHYSPKNTITFYDTKIASNIAFLGGGIAIYDSIGSPPVAFSPECGIYENIALEYGGGIYFSAFEVNQTFFYSSDISLNSAIYGGGAVAWNSLSSSQTGFESSFCENCTFSNNTAGYQNSEGFATPPVNTSFSETATCPNTLHLDGDSFEVGVMLQDHFGTLVKGQLLLDSQFNVSVSCDKCMLTPSTVSKRLPPDGTIIFSSLELSGKNGTSCNLDFSTKEYYETFNNIPVPDFQDLNCNITLAGCPNGEVVNEGDTYDTCQNASFWQLNRIYVLFFVITGLLMALILVIALQITLWYQKKRKKNWGKDINVPDLGGGKTSITLEDILNDPNIPHIPWEQIEVGRKLGIGAAAIVRQGLWIHNGKGSAVALKQLLLPTQQITSDILKDFLVEIKLTAALYHDHVVRLIGVSSSPELDLYLVTELMERGSIRDVLDKKGKNLRWDIRLKLLCDAAKGMSYLHSRNVIHRDLKPRNLLVTRDWVCKVADFGASTIQVQVAKTMTVIGTPAYMAPEVLAHTKYSEKADVYSFGIIIVEVYTGEQPYTGPEFSDIMNNIQLISRIVNEHLHPDTSKLPPALAHLVYDCWNEEPALRPSFSEIIIRLRRLGKIEMRKSKNNNHFSDDEDSKTEESSKEEEEEEEEEEDKKRETSIENTNQISIPKRRLSDSISPQTTIAHSPLLSDDPILHPTNIRSQILLLDEEETQNQLNKEALTRSNSLAHLLPKKKKRNTISGEQTPLLGDRKSFLYNTTNLSSSIN